MDGAPKGRATRPDRRHGPFLGLVLTAITACQPNGPTDVPPPWQEGAPPPGDGILRALYDSVSLDALPRRDDVPFESRMISSHDRTSVSPESPGWFANRDWAGREGTAPDGVVLFDEVGPGVITRIWSANPSGRVRFQFDDEASPAWDVDLAELLQGKSTIAGRPFARPLAGSSTSTWPIPFARRLRITSTVPAFYYQIDFRRFADGTDVGSREFEAAHASPEKDRVVAVTDGQRPPEATDGATSSAVLSVSGADALTIVADDGGSEIVELAFGLHLEDEVREQTILRINVDGERTVFVPIARFLLLDPLGSIVDSLPITTDQMTATSIVRFRMPFESEVRIDLVSPTGSSGSVDVRASTRPRPTGPDDFRFHATWTGPVVTEARFPEDVLFVRIDGSGRYVGTSLRFGNPERLGWWGEGDEKIWIDDPSFPARFGTGTEDYYGYSFCTSERFSTPWIGQFRSNLEDFGGIIELYRFHFADAMSFDTSLTFVQEVRHWHADSPDDLRATLDLDGVSYFYAAPGATITTPWDEAVPHPGMRLPPEVLVPMGSGTASCR